VTPLAELFPDGDYRFHLTLRRDEPREFFRPTDPSDGVRAERARWLADDARRYAELRPEGIPLLAEFAELTREWELGSADDVLALGRDFEPDILFLSSDDSDKFRLRGGALVFPTGWALQDKIGHPMDFIHGVVPGLNAALASPIQQFLARLKPGIGFFRDNWGLAATDELNLHPARSLPAPTPPVALDRLWLRVEHQVLLALPRTHGIVFGIRIALHRLDGLAADRAIAAGLRRALESMPADVAAYKRIDLIRPGVIKLL
jgi:hypothetical protein